MKESKITWEVLSAQEGSVPRAELVQGAQGGAAAVSG